jgi:hypothetical protein
VCVGECVCVCVCMYTALGTKFRINSAYEFFNPVLTVTCNEGSPVSGWSYTDVALMLRYTDVTLFVHYCHTVVISIEV